MRERSFTHLSSIIQLSEIGFGKYPYEVFEEITNERLDYTVLFQSCNP
jgi:hypothetical protein